VTGGWYQIAGTGVVSAATTLIKGSGATNPLGGNFRADFGNTSGGSAQVIVYAICVTP
jgi:hypothetical protein